MSIRPSSLLRVSLLLFVAALVGPSAPSQVPTGKPETPAGGFVAREAITVTSLDVVVTDSKGNRVTGLKKEDFVVVEDNLEQTITNFSPVEQGRFVLPAEETPPAPAPLLRLPPRPRHPRRRSGRGSSSSWTTFTSRRVTGTAS